MREKEYSDEQFKRAVQKHSPASTQEVADEVDCSRPLADGRLKDLLDKTDLQRKKIAKVSVWYYECR